MATRGDIEKRIDDWAKWAGNRKAHQQALTIIKAWAEHDDEAGELITADGKSLGKCWNAVTDHARKAGGSSPGDEDVVEWVLEYFGVKDAKGKAEGGVIYWYYMAMAEKYRPYGVDVVEAEAQPARACGKKKTAGKADDGADFDLFQGLTF